jgi:iron complex outermembrane receptor protein
LDRISRALFVAEPSNRGVTMQFILVQKKATTRRAALAAALMGGVALGALAAANPAEAQQAQTGQQVTSQQTRAQAARAQQRQARQAQRGQQPAAAPAGAVQLDTIDVRGDQIRRPALLGAPPPVFAGGQVASGARIGALGNQPLMSTPFAVQAITSQVAQEQQLQQLPDLAKYDASLAQNVGRYTYFDSVNIRGFQASNLIEGVPTARGIIQQTEPFERFEILRGPGATALSTISGFGLGAINLIPKRAGDAPLTEVTARYLGGAAFGTHLDVGRRFGANKEWGVRFNGAFVEGESAVSETRLSSKIGHLALDYRGERLRVTFDLNASDNFPRGVSPGLFIPGGFAVPRPPRLDRSFGPSWTDSHTERVYGILRAEYDLRFRGQRVARA